MLNTLSSINGLLSRVGIDTTAPIPTIQKSSPTIVTIGGERFVIGIDKDLIEVDVANNVRGGGMAKLKWATPRLLRTGAPVSVFIGQELFWSGKAVHSNDTMWYAEPLQDVFNRIYFYEERYNNQIFQGTVSKLIETAFDYAIKYYPVLKKRDIVSSDLIVEYDINGKTLTDILKFCGEQSENANAVYGVDNQYTLFFRNINAKNIIKIEEHNMSLPELHLILNNCSTINSNKPAKAFKAMSVSVKIMSSEDFFSL